MTTPLLSIGMPVYNCERTIAQTMRSVLRQTFVDWELLVYDDGSKDRTLAILQEFADPRIRIVHDGRNRGLPARLNLAIDAARGEYFARMDGDDVCFPDRLEVQLAYLRNHPALDLVGGGLLVFLDERTVLGKRTPPEEHEAICRAPFRGFPVAHPTYFGRTAWFRKFRYCEGAVRCEDQDLLLRAHSTSRFGNVPQIVLGYREQTDMRKILLSRRYFAQRLLWHHLRIGKPIAGLRGYSEQFLKGLADAAISQSSSNKRKVIRRAEPLTAAESKRWEELLSVINV